MHKFFETITKKDSRGKLVPVPGATLSVYETGTSNLITIYADDGTTPIVNPVTADANGCVEFKMPNGIVDLAFNDGVSERRVNGYVAIGGSMI